MHVNQGIIHATLLCISLSSFPNAVTIAAEASPGGSTGPLPGVDGFNAKASAFGGAAGDQALFGGEGSITMPLGFRYGLQLDGLVGGLESESQGDVTSGGSAGHLFWRDPSIGLLGAYGHYVGADSFGGVSLFAGGVEGALYLGRFTVEGVVGADGGNVDLGTSGSFGIDARFFDVASLSYYPVDNLRLSLGQGRVLGLNAALFGAEWGVATAGGTMSALYARGIVSEGGDGAVLGGLRFYFGERQKTLIRHHREDDPSLSTLQDEFATLEAEHQLIVRDSLKIGLFDARKAGVKARIMNCVICPRPL